MKKHIKKTIQASRSQLQKQIQTQKRLNLILIAALIVLSAIVPAYIFLSPKASNDAQRLVTFYDQGVERVVLTQASTVRDALKAAAIEIDAHDTVDPTIDSRLDQSYVDVIIYRSRPVSVVDGNIRQSVMTVAQSPNEILKAANLKALGTEDKASFSYSTTGTKGTIVLNVERAKLEPQKAIFMPKPNALTKSKGAQVFVDSSGVAHRETYYDLPMNIVIRACGPSGSYSVRSDGAKIDQDGYVLVAAGLSAYPRCTIVETSLGPGKVYDTGGFATRHPYGFDLATDWTNYNGQ